MVPTRLLTPHSVALLLPKQSGAERAGLRDHIKEHGILSPLQVIWVPSQGWMRPTPPTWGSQRARSQSRTEESWADGR